MNLAAAFPLLAADVSPRRAGERRVTPCLGLMASIVLHGAMLAGVAEWNGDRADASTAMEVTILLERPPEAPAAVAPSPPAKPRADPPRHRNEAAPRHVVSTKPLSRPALPAAEPGQASAVSSDSLVASAGGLPGAKGETSAGDVGLGGAGTVSDAQAMPSPNNPAPTYPPSARRAGREGRTALTVVVGANGACMDVEIAESSGTPSLDEAAAAAVRRWRFTPALRAGRAVEATIRVPVVFRLTETS